MAASAQLENLNQEKQLAAAVALRWVRSGMRVGLGSGSTAACFIRLLGDAVREGQLQIEATATSLASEQLAREVGIPLVEPRRGLRFDLTVDGADELDGDLQLLKGGGGALLREKIVAAASDYLLIIADSSKEVIKLGQFPLPLEVVPFALPWVLDAVAELGGEPVLRMHPHTGAEPAHSDQGNLLVDCHFQVVSDAPALAAHLKTIPGVVEHGLFLGMAQAAVVARGTSVVVLRPGQMMAPAAAFSTLP
ncbi:ribose-5-phosphate isomerase RpiA [Hymenobacter metallicola]|uniref:Ribose-5-phosphate isomerase A n=1 Tax=Hymenobacter metallicola TaxID=2563114 RepID=A0A4Z0QDX7_9BACT|nr:ribose-5-phosphate isomerase RpiA [Hymenobacter metallicola]TGE28267.1 ribose-5-phosphate isomerase RpiA [Hymenobacter metallicola]